MKTPRCLIVLLALFTVTQLLTSCSGYIVAEGPPPPPNEVIVVAPSPRYVWVPGYYTYRGSSYIWIQGSYQIPPQGRKRYVQGDWVKTPKGYKRGKGHWK